MSADPIVWEGSIDDGAADAPRRMRVTKLLAQSGVESFIVEVHTQDAQKRDAWLETDDYVDTGAAAWATVEAQWKELEELRRRASAREVLPDLRERTSVELADALGVDVTTRWPVLLDKVRDLAVTDCAPASQAAQGIASLRAELTALGKHVEDVERRAYASPTNDALTVELGHNINAPPGQIITTGERLDSLERRVSDNTDALALWQGAVDRLAAKVDAAVELGAKRWSDLGAIEDRMLHAEQVIRQLVDTRTSDLASLRAELTALGKHVEDVERRAYDTPTKAEHEARRTFDDEATAAVQRVTRALNEMAEHPVAKALPKLGERISVLEGLDIIGRCEELDEKIPTGRASQQELDDFRKATELWQSQHAAQASAMSTIVEKLRADIDETGRTITRWNVRIDTRVEALENTSAGKAETLEAVRSLTDALQALEGRLADVEASVGQPGPLDALENRVERLEGHIEHRAWTAITQRVEALEMKVDDLAAGWGSCGPARPDEKREAVIREHEAGYREAPLDLATLRVSGQATGASETAVSFRPAGHALDIVTEVRVLPGYGSEERHEWVTVDPHSARIIARALTQWADGAEKGAGK